MATLSHIFCIFLLGGFVFTLHHYCAAGQSTCPHSHFPKPPASLPNACLLCIALHYGVITSTEHLLRATLVKLDQHIWLKVEEEKSTVTLLTEKDASGSIWYLAAMPKRVLLFPAVQARLTAVSSLSFTFW